LIGDSKLIISFSGSELRNAVTNLNALSNNTARRLDNAYWRVLEKVSDLQRTIAAMKEIAGMTRQLHETFKQESQDIVTEVEATIEGFQGFEEQEIRIQGLATRVKAGREKIQSLGDRVEVVRERADGWEREVEEWRERTRKRLKVLWIVIGVCGALFLAGTMWWNAPARSHGPGVLKGLDASVFAGSGMDTEGVNESLSLKRNSVPMSEKLNEKTQSQKRMDNDPRLRMFDEL
jgi:hypothetical protein